MATILPTRSTSVEASLEQQIPWRQAMKEAIRSAHALCRFVDVDPSLACPEAAQDFPVFVPLPWAGRIERGNPADPLLRQVLATSAETLPDGLLDPVGDLSSLQGKGLMQKYKGRVLLITTGACAVHCRYCFRRHFPYEQSPKGRTEWSVWLEHIRNDRSIQEVILSGGDPLTVADETLSWFAAELGEIEHVRRLRIHTRVPVVIPQRVCSSLLDWISRSRQAVFIVLHVNHSQELDGHVGQAASRLRSAGATLLNQAVLLKGINDSLAALKALSLILVDHQILPYYLHQLDPVQGALHFGVQDAKAKRLVNDLRSELPGYAVPQLVREVPKRPSKTQL